MSKDPAVLFYTSDFITGTLTMSDEQRGKYIVLLCLQHQQGFLTDEDMLNICKTHDKKIYAKFIRDTSGLYYNERMRDESDRRRKYSESRSKNRKTSKTYDEHMETETETITVNKDIIPFEDFWNLYDKKVGDKKACEKKWNKLKDSERDDIIKTLPLFISTLKDKQFQPFPATYLNQHRWEDEITTTQKKVKGNEDLF